MALSEARKRANTKYNLKAYDEFKLRVIKGNKEIIQGYCRDKNTSVNSLMNELLKEQLQKDGYEMITKTVSEMEAEAEAEKNI